MENNKKVPEQLCSISDGKSAGVQAEDMGKEN